MNRMMSDSKDFTNFFQAVAGDGDPAVDGGVEAEIVAAGTAWGEGPDAI